MTLPTDAKARKQVPICTGVVDYFPDALIEIAQVSFVGNEQHNPGQPLHWAKEKSIGRGDEIMRHLIERGTRDTDGLRHTAKLAWRALELLQREIEAERAVQTPILREYSEVFSHDAGKQGPGGVYVVPPADLKRY